VAIGREPGIYMEWTEAQKAFQGWKGVKQQSFKTRAEAVDYIRRHGNEAGLKAIENEIIEPPPKKSKSGKTGRNSKTIANGILHIYTDGSSRGNGKVGASAGVGVFFGESDPRFVFPKVCYWEAIC
jgi:ribonuclease HI